MSTAHPDSQSEKSADLLRRSGPARVPEFRAVDITAATPSRIGASRAITRPAQGLYQLANANSDANHAPTEDAWR
jgi:hypothetical protein